MAGATFQVLSELYQDTHLRGVCLENFPVTAATAEAAMLLATQLALQLYRHQPGLTTLHAVTGGHALIEVHPHIHRAARAASAALYWIWLSTLFVEKGAPRVSHWAEAEEALITWPEVRRAALRPLAPGAAVQAEVHAVKLVCTCDALFQRRAHPLYLEIASRTADSGKPW